MMRLHLKRLVAICVLIGFITYYGGGNSAQATLMYSTKDTPTMYKAPDRFVNISGSDMVWKAQDNSGKDQLYYRNLVTGEAKQLTDTSGVKSVPDVGGDYVTYVHRQKDLILLNIRSGESLNIASTPGTYESPTTDGHYVAVPNKSDNFIYVYDIASKTNKRVGQGINAVVAEGEILYVQLPSKDLQLYDIATEKTRKLTKPTDGYVDTFYGPAFNGKTAVWLQKMNAGGYETRSQQTDHDDALPQLLARSDAAPKSQAPIAIGDHISAWHQTVNDNDEIAVADLAYSEAHILVDKASVNSLVGIYNNQVVLRGDDGNIFLREVNVSGQSVAPTAPIASAVPYVEKWAEPVNQSMLFFSKDRAITSQDKSIMLKMKEWLFQGDGDVNMEPNPDRDLQLTKALLPGQKMVSLPWNVSMPDAKDALILSMSYIASRVPKEQINKLGIYRLEGGSWEYVGGLLEQETNQIYTPIIKPGTYIILYYNVSNPYVRDYWINKRITQMTDNDPIRVFLDGEEIQFHEAPILQEGSTTVEFRPIFEKLGLKVNWDDATKTVTGQKEGKSLRLPLGKKEAEFNDLKMNIPVAPFLYKDYTFVPLRFVGEATGRKVMWDANLKTVYLYDLVTEGKLYYNGGALMYEGQLEDGHMNGKGKLYREDGTLWYDAEFKNDEVVGLGTIYFQGFSRGRDRTGEMSIGQFVEGIPEGNVRYVDDSGYVFYEGKVIKGLYSGQGKYYVANQLIYEGEFKDNMYDGRGKYYINGKLFYEGDFAVNTPNGYGKEYNKAGNREGEFKQGVMNGKGIWYYSSGTKLYEGEFVNNIWEGQGKIYSVNGMLKKEGQFKNNYFVKGTYYYTDGTKYVGELAHDVPNGQGILYDKNGNIEFQGQFKENVPVK
ncbi:hypothetical protein QFZ81_007456 [Paenibacillus sp. V4I9]|uniref:stalk domain-containing protein n=1 Tax=Paenibacillus sp. V4I9 TaxID=3042308 RepID=UPI00277F641C|nr:stalk domain-containing protein [Paenibacillus sp. V4I9]MDQ0892368.1 hypothetical protein [Paenibacillus sp. V4I9]